MLKIKKIIAFFISFVMIVNIFAVSTLNLVYAADTDNSAAMYVPNFVKTDDASETQTLFNPETAKMALSLSQYAYKVQDSSDDPDDNIAVDWAKGLEKYGYDYSQSYRICDGATYEIFKMVPVSGSEKISGSSLNATIGIKEVVYNSKKLYSVAIAFRGSDDLTDWLNDSVPYNLDGYHCGFYRVVCEFLEESKRIKFNVDNDTVSLYSIFNDMKDEDSKYRLIITGHSLGGAVADVLSSRLQASNVRAQNFVTYTFAAARSVNDSISYPYTNVFNIINSDDAVPMLGRLVSNFGGDEHIGTNITYNPNDEFRSEHYELSSQEEEDFWNNFVFELFGVDEVIENWKLFGEAHDKRKSYGPILNIICDNLTDYCRYNTVNTRLSDCFIDDDCYSTFNNVLICGNVSIDGSTKLCVKGNIGALNNSDHEITGTLLLCGERVQTIEWITALNIEITNTVGIQLFSDIYVTGFLSQTTVLYIITVIR